MATRIIEQWFFSEEDKKQIKSYSKDISRLFKLKGYNPKCDCFEDYFNLEEFEFIPCIKNALDHIDSEEDIDEITTYIDEAYEMSVKVTLEELKKNEEERGKTVKERLVNAFYSSATKTTVDLIEFVLNCGNDTVIQKFVDFLMN